MVKKRYCTLTVARVASFFSSQPHLRRTGEQHPGTRALRQPEHVECALGAGLDGLDGVVLVVGRGRWASQVVDLVYFELEAEATKRTTKAKKKKKKGTTTNSDNERKHQTSNIRHQTSNIK